MIRREPLGNGIDCFVSDNHTFGTDAVLLADFASPKRNETAADLGTGCGIIPLLWCRENAPKKIYGVDIQEEACMLAQKGAEYNNLTERFTAVNADLKDLKGKIPFGEMGLVTCNPPYKADGAGIKNQKASQTTARHETACTLEDIIFTASKLLQSGGRLCVCHRPERLTDILCLMRKYKIEPKKIRHVANRVGREPWLILIEGKRGAKSGIRISPTLYIEDQNGTTAEMNEIYGSYRENAGCKPEEKV